ncbi:MAG TPA: hypothetical protein VJN64_13605 [Terriglobales bacterium]|nr:hypothetical protein [Terriglobales bacterium]
MPGRLPLAPLTGQEGGWYSYLSYLAQNFIDFGGPPGPQFKPNLGPNRPESFSVTPPPEGELKVTMAQPTAAPVFTSLNYLFSHLDGKTVAHCLDLDIVTSGADLREAEQSLNALVLRQLSICFISGNFDQLRFKAPSEYWEMSQKARLLETVRLEVEIPPVVIPVTKKWSIPVTRAESMEPIAA